MELMEGTDAARSSRRCWACALPDPFPRMTYRRGDAPLRLRQARPAHPARAGGRGRPGQGLRLQGVRRSRQGSEGPGRGVARAGRRRAAALSRSTSTRSSSARYGAKGLAYIKVNERARGRDGLQSPIIKFLSDAALAGILERTGAADNDLIFFGADSAKVVSDALGALRLQDRPGPEARAARLAAAVGGRLPDVRVGRRERALGRDASSVHRAARSTIRRRCVPTRARRSRKAYDMVLNGSEIGGGSVRIHRQEMQSTVFELLGIGAEEAQRKFGFLLDALQIRRAAARRHRLRPRPARRC